MKRKRPKVQGDRFSSKTTVLQAILERARQKLSLFRHTVAKETRPGIHGLQLRASVRNKWKITSASVPGNVYNLGLGSVNSSRKSLQQLPRSAGRHVVFCLSAHTGKQRGLENRAPYKSFKKNLCYFLLLLFSI